MTPEGANLDGATICECAATNAQGECICGGGRVERNNPEGGTHCVCIRGTAEVGGVCVNREGPIGGVSEGLAAQVTLCRAFGGEVLGGEGEEILGEIAAGTAKDLDDSFVDNAASDYPDETIALRRSLRSWLQGDNNYWDTHNLGGIETADLIGAWTAAIISNAVSGIGYLACISTGAGGTDARDFTQCIFDQITQDANLVGESARMEGEAYGCRGVDKSGTFCLLGSLEVFPCRGLFTRARDCNIKYNRPLLNPFLCAGTCRVTTPPLTPRGPTCE